MMKKLVLAFLVCLGVAVSAAEASDHSAHARHNMIVFGNDEVFASHIVYKVPHNFQVLLKLKLNPEVKEAYLAAKKVHGTSSVILLLDSMDIGQIASQDSLTGTLLYRDPADREQVIVPNVTFFRGEFELIYFDELPLSLAKGHH